VGGVVMHLVSKSVQVLLEATPEPEGTHQAYRIVGHVSTHQAGTVSHAEPKKKRHPAPRPPAGVRFFCAQITSSLFVTGAGACQMHSLCIAGRSFWTQNVSPGPRLALALVR